MSRTVSVFCDDHHKAIVSLHNYFALFADLLICCEKKNTVPSLKKYG